MKNRTIALSLIAIVAAVAILFSACKKINEATELGGDLIPPVDNINTFDTNLNVLAFNDTFGLANDSQYLTKDAEYFLGKINSDPVFGQTDARIFLELKPPFFKYTFQNRFDSLYIDSVVLVLDYLETYGDSTTPQTVNVFELDPVTTNFRSDTSYLVRQNPFIYTSVLGTRTFQPRILDDTVKAYRDTSTHQLRIRLNNSFGTRLLNFDSTGTTGGFSSDSVFKTKFRGFALQSMSTGNAIMGFDLTGANTKLAIYYRYNHGGVNKFDTTVDYFGFNSFCGSANYVKRDYTGTPLMGAITNNPTSSDALIYLQNSPGTFVNLKIPALQTLSNRVIHRAELIVEQYYHVTDSLFRPPDFLYLDASDPTITTNNKFRSIPYDLAYSSSGSLNLDAFGVAPYISPDPSGNKVRMWKFNISRYVQHVLTHTQSYYDLRLSAPYTLTDKYGIPPGADINLPLQINNSIAKGRVRLVGTDPSATNPQRIRLHIIYSKL